MKSLFLYLCILVSTTAFADEAGLSTDCNGNCSITNTTTAPTAAIRVDFDACVTDPNASVLQKQWQNYQDNMKIKTAVNASTLADRARLSTWADDPSDTRMLQFIDSMHNLQNVSQLLDQIEGMKELQPLIKNPHFMDVLHSADFLQKVKSGTLMTDINDSSLEYLKSNADFQQAIKDLSTELQKKDVSAAVDVLKDNNISMVSPQDRASYKSLENFFNTHGSTVDAVQTWKTNPPLVKNVPLPKGLTGIFAAAYNNVVQSEIERDLRDHQITLADARKIDSKITQDQVDAINSAEPPDKKNAYDEFIRKKYLVEGPTTANLDGVSTSITADQSAAISGVARTLWGEVRGCAAAGLPQFEAVGRIIGDRAVDVCRDIKSKLANKAAVLDANEKNYENFLQQKDESDAAKKIVYRGYSEFGRTDLGDVEIAKDMNCASQVISRDLQFSVWNSFTKTVYSKSFSSPNLPSVRYTIPGAQRPGDEQALNNILCPSTKLKDGQTDPLWEKALKIATEIVLKPESLAQKYRWSSNDPEILFYTHAAPLPFAKPISVGTITDETGKAKALRGQGHGTCDQFELFTPKVEGGY